MTQIMDPYLYMTMRDLFGKNTIISNNNSLMNGEVKMTSRMNLSKALLAIEKVYKL